VPTVRELQLERELAQFRKRGGAGRARWRARLFDR
jgi:hypothetical protein